MTDDHNLYQDIGALKADAKTAQNQRATLFEKVDELGRAINSHNSQVNDKLNEILSMKGQVERHETDIAGLKSFKNRTLIGLAAIFGGGGVVGAYLDKLKDLFHVN